jgi:hypothetical protein
MAPPAGDRSQSMSDMAVGTTRQLLKDLATTQNRESPVHVLRSHDGVVQVTVSPDAVSVRCASRALFYVPATIGGVAVLSGLLTLMIGRPFLYGMLLLGWAAITLIFVLLAERDRAGRAYVFRVGREIISADSAGLFGPRHWEWKRDGVRDVRVVRGKRSALWFELTPGWRHGHAFVLPLSDEDLLALTNALREGLGLPSM